MSNKKLKLQGSEASRAFDEELANSIWLKCKNRSVDPEDDVLDIIGRYWHRAIEKE